MKIGNHDLEKEVLVVAEIGNNHEGRFDQAADMIRHAASAGAGAVKFQTINPSSLISSVQRERLCQLEAICLGLPQFEKLARVANQEKVIFLSTPFDLESVAVLAPLVPAFKIASGDNLFFPLLDAVVRTAKPLIVSAGLCTWSEIVQIHDYIHNAWRKLNLVQDLSILHCVASYPTPDDQANLLRITRLKTLDCTVGYSDHTLGIEAAVLAVALGARIIEKHFTLDKSLSYFRDHRLSADPAELAELVRRVRQAEKLLGRSCELPSECESEGQKAFRRSIAAAEDLSSGSVLMPHHLMWVRPGMGLAPGREADLIGKALNRSVRRGEVILSEFVE
jgi:N-acetylneuraminate synthase/N,N'-diacetyllegionaminate synthase